MAATPLTNMFNGVATLGAGGTIAVALAQILATSTVIMSMASTNNAGTPEYAITAGTGFTITSSNAGDTGNVSWIVIL